MTKRKCGSVVVMSEGINFDLFIWWGEMTKDALLAAWSEDRSAPWSQGLKLRQTEFSG